MQQHAPHDLLWVDELIHKKKPPKWFELAYSNSQPVVVRRQQTPVNLIAVGVRGGNRSERYPCYALQARVKKSLTPEKIVQDKAWQSHQEKKTLKQWYLLDQIDKLCEQYSIHWGLTGSFAFEIASGIKVVTHSSDIDLRILCNKSIEKNQCWPLFEKLNAMNCLIDAQIETPLGAFSLREWMLTDQAILLKTNTGPILTQNPWHDPSLN